MVHQFGHKLLPPAKRDPQIERRSAYASLRRIGRWIWVIALLAGGVALSIWWHLLFGVP